MKNGETYFLALPVKPGFYGKAGGPLLRRWRISILIPLLLDLAINLADPSTYVWVGYVLGLAAVMTWMAR